MSDMKPLPDHMARLTTTSDIRLETLTDENKSILDLMFLPEYHGCFRVGALDSKEEQEAYVDEISHPDRMRAGYVIVYRDQIVGFILMHGKNNLLVGGLKPAYTREGIYRIARNTFIYAMNQQGIYRITSTVSKDNRPMYKFLSKQHQTRWFSDMYINHVHPLIPIGGFTHIDVKPDVVDAGFPAILVSTSPLYQVGDEVPKETLLTYSWELGFRAIFNDILFQSLGLDAVQIYVYTLDYSGSKLTPATVLDDYSVTLAFRSGCPTRVMSVDRLTVNTCDDRSYMYCLSDDGKLARKHSYAKIEKVNFQMPTSKTF